MPNKTLRDIAIEIGINVNTLKPRINRAEMAGRPRARVKISSILNKKPGQIDRAEYDENKKTMSNRPAHTWESHGAGPVRRPESIRVAEAQNLGPGEL